MITNLRMELFEALLDIPLTRFPCVGDVRGCGLVQSLEIVEDKEGKVGTNNHKGSFKNYVMQWWHPLVWEKIMGGLCLC